MNSEVRETGLPMAQLVVLVPSSPYWRRDNGEPRRYIRGTGRRAVAVPILRDGCLLVDMIDIREPSADEAEKRLRRLVRMIDVIRIPSRPLTG
jgi:hypothetical protein